MIASILLFLWLPLSSVANPTCDEVAAKLKNGDLVFLSIDKFLFRQVAKATLSWTNHVGIAFQGKRGWLVYESTFPFSKVTSLCDYMDRSLPGMVGVKRLADLSEDESKLIRKEAKARLGILYHQGFDYDSSRQFCSKFVYDVFASLRRQEIGHKQTFADLFRNAEEKMSRSSFEDTKSFFDWWFAILGGIPYDRTTVTPASQWEDPDLESVIEPVLSNFEEL